jgi:methionyl-tRNA synthetase
MLLRCYLALTLAPVPHIGHLYSLVTADIFARHAQLARPDKHVSFLTGTDEHGLKIQRAAEAENKEPREFCDRISERFRVCLYDRQ